MHTLNYFLITCEHAGNRIPSSYRALFRGKEALLHTHRAYDLGALRVARELSATFSAPLLVSTVSRLLIDLNRSLGQPDLFSEATRPLSDELRNEIVTRYYLPYRTKAETLVAQAIDTGARVVHVSCHSFTPELNGEKRDTDIGLLYDPDRSAEVALCRHWRVALQTYPPALQVRMNYPYAGTSDGFTVYLRQRFPVNYYLGIELEVNQKHMRDEGAPHWRAVRGAITHSFHTAALQMM